MTVYFAGILAYIVTVRAEKWLYFYKAVFPRSAQGHAYRIKPCKVRCNSFFLRTLIFCFRLSGSEFHSVDLGTEKRFDFDLETMLKHFTFVLSRFSGVSHDRPSVVSIETVCHQGQLQWTDPFGGLRVTFNPRMKVHSDFKLCFTARHPGVRIYREGMESLTLLSEDVENVTKTAVCIKSKGEQLPVLYLETQENQTLTQVNYTVLVNGRKRPRHGRTKGEQNGSGRYIQDLTAT